MIKNIKIDELNTSFKINNKAGQPYYELVGLNKINIFVGPNNSGKSRFLRQVINASVDNFYFFTYEIDEINEKLKMIAEIIDDHDHINGEEETHTTIRKKRTPAFYEFFVNIKNLITDLDNKKNNLCLQKNYRVITSKIKDNLNICLSKLNELDKQKLAVKAKGASQDKIISKIEKGIEEKNGLKSKELIEYLKNKVSLKDIDFEFKKVYIPILRGLRPINLKIAKKEAQDLKGFEEEKKYYEDSYKDGHASSKEVFNDVDVYSRRTRRDYFRGSNGRYEIFTGLDLYDEIKRMLLGKEEERTKVRDFESFLSEKFFEGQKITLIPSINDDVLIIKIGNEEDRPIYDLGDGLQELIIIFFILHKYQEQDLLLFIEEPELMLHPGLQRKMLEVCCENGNFKNAQFFFNNPFKSFFGYHS